MNSTRDLVGAARDIVRRRFDDREELAIEILNHQCGTDSVHARAAEQVFDALESATGIPAGRLRPQDNFGMPGAGPCQPASHAMRSLVTHR